MVHRCDRTRNGHPVSPEPDIGPNVTTRLSPFAAGASLRAMFGGGLMLIDPLWGAIAALTLDWDHGIDITDHRCSMTVEWPACPLRTG